MTVSSTKQHSGPRPQVVRFEPSASPRARPRARWQCPRSYPQLLWNTYTRKNEDAQHDTTTTIHHLLRSSSMDHADVRMCRRRPERQTVAVCQLRHCGTAVMKTAHSGLLPSANTPAPPRPSHSPSPTDRVGAPTRRKRVIRTRALTRAKAAPQRRYRAVVRKER